MSEEQKNAPKEPPAGPFRWNAKVLQMVALVMVALALPLTIAIFGIRDIRIAVQPTPESPGLRAVLENVVNQNWQAPFLEGAVRSSLREVPDGNACLKIGEAVQKIARDSGGVVLTPEKIESGGTRWLVQVPANQKDAFETALAAMGFSSFTGVSKDDPVFYFVEIRIAP
jgi:hypothetical protein